jgi:hypothetical protein
VFRQVIETNVLGMVNTFAPFIAAMRARGSGTLAGIASVAGFRGWSGSGAPIRRPRPRAITYLESLRLELRDAGICRGHDLPRLYRDADDWLPIATRCRFLLDPDKAARLIARAIRTAQALLRAAVADGDRRIRVAAAAASDLRRDVCASAAQDARISAERRLRSRPKSAHLHRRTRRVWPLRGGARASA